LKQLGYGAGYEYDQGAEYWLLYQNYFPDGMDRVAFYEPKNRGFEREIARRLEYWTELRGSVAKARLDLICRRQVFSNPVFHLYRARVDKFPMPPFV
jgi:hypothetical protein